MSKQITEIKEFLVSARRRDATIVKIRKNANTSARSGKNTREIAKFVKKYIFLTAKNAEVLV